MERLKANTRRFGGRTFYLRGRPFYVSRPPPGFGGGRLPYHVRHPRGIMSAPRSWGRTLSVRRPPPKIKRPPPKPGADIIRRRGRTQYSPTSLTFLCWLCYGNARAAICVFILLSLYVSYFHVRRRLCLHVFSSMTFAVGLCPYILALFYIYVFVQFLCMSMLSMLVSVSGHPSI